MDSRAEKVVQLSRRKPQQALENLNRLTGLRFSSWPESLRDLCQAETLPCPAASRREAAGG